MRDIAIVGAGPYGLSLAAHLDAAGSDFRIFGIPMQSWTQSMPKGMHLKSEGFASTLYDPGGRFPFSQYCRERGIDYADLGRPVSLKDFADYGRIFQARYAPMLEQKQVVRVGRSGSGFEIVLDDGETAEFRRVILAVGITRYAHVPRPFDRLPEGLLSHASAHHDMARFADKTVAVIGSGSSATDCAAALIEASATVHIVARAPELKFHAPPKGRTLLDRIRWPMTTIGSGWRSVFCTQAPLAFHAMPQRLRHEATRRHLGPASCWFTKERVEGHARVHAGSEVTQASARGDRAALTLVREGRQSALEADHVIAATGYKVDVDRLGFLDPDLRGRVRLAEKTPVLSRSFESSVPGLYFVGVSSANSFGPVVRFACGAQFTARRLTKHLARKRVNTAPTMSADAIRPAVFSESVRS